MFDVRCWMTRLAPGPFVYFEAITRACSLARYGMIGECRSQLAEFMGRHGFTSLADFKGRSLPYITTHTDLVRLQREAIEEKKKAKVGLGNDDAWSGDDFVKQSDSMVSN